MPVKRLIPLLLLLFFLSLLSTQTRRAPWYEQWGWNIFSPVTRLFSFFQSKTKALGRQYLFLVHVAQDNEELRSQTQVFKQERVTFKELKQENDRLARLLELKQNRWPTGLTARVIGFDPRSEFRVIQIDKGMDHGVQPDMPVLALAGLVGKVGPVFKRAAAVLLIVDPASFVDGVVQRSQVRCLLGGTGLLRHAELKHDYLLSRLEYLNKGSDVVIGDTVVTSGLDGLYPKGILLGTLTRVVVDRYGLFLKADVLPAVDFSQLREVLVLKE